MIHNNQTYCNAFSKNISQHEYAKVLRKNLPEIEEDIQNPGKTFKAQRIFDQSMAAISEGGCEVLVVKSLGGKSQKGEIALPKTSWKLKKSIPENWIQGDIGTYYKDPHLINKENALTWAPNQEDIGKIFELVASDPNVPWDYIVDYCNIRAHYSAQILLHMNIVPQNVRKVFCFGNIKNDWRFHVATLIVDSKGNEWAIDPSLFATAVKVEKWIEEVNCYNLSISTHKSISEGNPNWDSSEIHVYRCDSKERWIGCIYDLSKEKDDVPYNLLGNTLIRKNLSNSKYYPSLINCYWSQDLDMKFFEYLTDDQKMKRTAINNHKIALNKVVHPDVIPTPEDIENISPSITLNRYFDQLRSMSMSFRPTDEITTDSIEKLANIGMEMQAELKRSIEQLEKSYKKAAPLLPSHELDSLKEVVNSKREELQDWLRTPSFDEKLKTITAFSPNFLKIKSFILKDLQSQPPSSVEIAKVKVIQKPSLCRRDLLLVISVLFMALAPLPFIS